MSSKWNLNKYWRSNCFTQLYFWSPTSSLWFSYKSCMPVWFLGWCFTGDTNLYSKSMHSPTNSLWRVPSKLQVNVSYLIDINLWYLGKDKVSITIWWLISIVTLAMKKILELKTLCSAKLVHLFQSLQNVYLTEMKQKRYFRMREGYLRYFNPGMKCEPIWSYFQFQWIYVSNYFHIKCVVFSSADAKASINSRSTRDQLDFCSPPKNHNSTVVFMSLGAKNNSSIIANERMEQENSGDFHNSSFALDDNHVNHTASINHEIYPLGTLVKFKCVRGPDGKYLSWQLRWTICSWIWINI